MFSVQREHSRIQAGKCCEFWAEAWQGHRGPGRLCGDKERGQVQLHSGCGFLRLGSGGADEEGAGLVRALGFQLRQRVGWRTPC